jgi:putative Holliday junction resolvase
MTVLGIDWGMKYIGLALGRTDTGIAHPLTNIPFKKAVVKITSVCRQENVKKIIIGISERKSADGVKRFAVELDSLNIPIEFSDETLSTHDAAGGGHAVAASIILGLWLDDHHQYQYNV